MARIRETDYHHSALVSSLVNNGYNLILLETHQQRRSYRVSQGREDFILYSKYCSKPSSQNNYQGSYTWHYSFTNEEVDRIKSYMKEFDQTKLALISKYNNNNGGELIVLNRDDFINCIGYGYEGESPYISVLKEKYCQVKVYGRGVSRDQAFIPNMRILNDPSGLKV